MVCSVIQFKKRSSVYIVQLAYWPAQNCLLHDWFQRQQGNRRQQTSPVASPGFGATRGTTVTGCRLLHYNRCQTLYRSKFTEINQPRTGLTVNSTFRN